MTQTRLDRLAQLATIFGALITAGSVIFGLVTYRRSMIEQRQATALSMLQEYLKLSVEHPDLANRASGQAIDARYDSFATHAMATAETLWLLVGNDPRWERSIDAVVLPHREYLTRGALQCENYQPEFVEYLQRRVPDVKCAR